TTQDNKTAAVNLGVNQSWTGGSLDAGLQHSEYTDITGSAHNLMTDSYNASWNCEVNKRLTTTLGGVLSDTHDQRDGSDLKTQTLTLNVNSTLQPDKIALRGNASLTD